GADGTRLQTGGGARFCPRGAGGAWTTGHRRGFGAGLSQKRGMMPKTALKSSGIVVPEHPRWHQKLAAFIIHNVLTAIAMTLRIRHVDRAGLREGNLRHPAIYCIWHNRLALSMKSYHGYIKKFNESAGLAAMASASRDGGMLI